MKASRRILVLHADKEPPLTVRQLAESITRQGSTAVVATMYDGQYDQVLDAVALADTVIYWPVD